MPVVMFEIFAGAPLVFYCDRLRASLSPSSCATNHRRTFNLACQGCPIGAEHAIALPKPTERTFTNYHDDDAQAQAQRFERTARPCIRCGRPDGRRIQPGLCVSCLNRHAEVMHGRNSKGKFPNRVAASLFHCAALITGDFPYLMSVLRFSSNCAPRLQRVTGGAFVSGVFGGRAEFCRWLTQAHPNAELLEFELGPSLAELQTHLAPAV